MLENKVIDNLDLSCSIEQNLNKLEQKINSLNSKGQFFSYEKGEDCKLYAVVNGTKLNIPFKDGPQLLKALETIKHCLETYILAGHKEKLYAEEYYETKGTKKPKIGLYVNNRAIISDTIFLSHQSLKNIFGINDNRNMKSTKILADYLNNILITQGKLNYAEK